MLGNAGVSPYIEAVASFSLTFSEYLMSETRVIFFPKDKSFVPDDEAIEKAVSFLDDVYDGDYIIDPEKYPTPVFIHTESAFGEFSCPVCKTVINYHNHSEWWREWIDIIGTPPFGMCDENQIVKVPCCSKELPIKNFDFGENGGLAMFLIHVEFAGDDEILDDQQLQQLEDILGCGMRRVVVVDY